MKYKITQILIGAQLTENHELWLRNTSLVFINILEWASMELPMTNMAQRVCQEKEKHMEIII